MTRERGADDRDEPPEDEHGGSHSDPGAAPRGPADTGPEETVFLGSFDSFKADLIIEFLAEHDIFAYVKTKLGDYTGFSYGVAGPTHPAAVFVDKNKLEEARRVVEAELPARLDEIEQEMRTLSGEPLEDIGEAEDADEEGEQEDEQEGEQEDEQEGDAGDRPADDPAAGGDSPPRRIRWPWRRGTAPDAEPPEPE